MSTRSAWEHYKSSSVLERSKKVCLLTLQNAFLSAHKFLDLPLLVVVRTHHADVIYTALSASVTNCKRSPPLTRGGPGTIAKGRLLSHEGVQVQFPEQTTMTQVFIIKWSVKWVVTSKLSVNEVEDCKGSRKSGDALVTCHRQSGTLPPVGFPPSDQVETVAVWAFRLVTELITAPTGYKPMEHFTYFYQPSSGLIVLRLGIGLQPYSLVMFWHVARCKLTRINKVIKRNQPYHICAYKQVSHFTKLNWDHTSRILNSHNMITH